MGTLNPSIPTPELTKTLNAAAARMKAFGKPYLTPALLLATFARDADNAAHRLLTSLAIERSFRLDELAISAEMLAKASPGADADFDFIAADGSRVKLSTEMLVVLDEGRSIAQASGRVDCGHRARVGRAGRVGYQHRCQRKLMN